MRIEASVTELHISPRGGLLAEQILALSEFERLQRLTLKVRAGTESALKETVQKLHDLRALSLSWSLTGRPR